MKRFVMNASIEFDAEDIDDALWRLAMHFLAVEHGEESSLDHMGELRIEPAQEPSND